MNRVGRQQSGWTAGGLVVLLLAALPCPGAAAESLPGLLEHLAVAAEDYQRPLAAVQAQQTKTTTAYDSAGEENERNVAEESIVLADWSGLLDILLPDVQPFFYFTLQERADGPTRIQFTPRHRQDPACLEEGAAPERGYRNPMTVTAELRALGRTLRWFCDARGWLELDPETAQPTRLHMEALGLPVSKRVLFVKEVTLRKFALEVEFGYREIDGEQATAMLVPTKVLLDIRSSEGHMVVAHELRRFQRRSLSADAP